jgi:hypothetical protein
MIVTDTSENGGIASSRVISGWETLGLLNILKIEGK